MMKNSLKLVITATLVASLFGCSNSDTYSVPEDNNCNDLTPTKTVADVLAVINTNLNQFNSSYDNDIIEAYVTSSDEGGNFFKSISLVSVDGSKGFSMPINAYNLYTKYEPGRKVFIKLKGRYYQKNADTDSPEIGSLYDNGTTVTTDDEVGRISALEYENVVTGSCSKISDDDLVNTTLSISQAKNDTHLNKLIEFSDVQFTDPSIGKKYYDTTLNDLGGATNHEIIDGSGNKVIVRVSSFATFAGNAVPSLNGKIRGVMTKFGSDYQFMVRTTNDIKLTNPRVVPIFEETFTTNFPSWVKYSVTGAQVWTLNSSNGNPGQCADMNGFSGGAVVNEDWLISPAIDLSSVSIAGLSFQTSRPFSGNNLQAYVSTNYSGSGAPSAATWTLLSSALMATSTTWRDSGNISLTAYVGSSNVRIAFKYTSTSTSAPQWRVDNVKVNPF
jgi:Family of unknown function (DUF5689)